MDWLDLLLRLIRAIGALAGALAGIAALFTDGAFVKRERPLGGWLKGTPLGKYSVTTWGAILLAVILMAPLVQFIGDWIKDANDTRALNNTASAIRRDIDDTVTSSTSKASDTITRLVASTTESALSEIDRTLYPFKDVWWAYEVRLDLHHPKIAEYRDFLRQKAKEIFAENPGFGEELKSGSHETGSTGYPNTDIFRRAPARARILIHIDSPLMPASKFDAYGAILWLSGARRYF